MKNRASKFRLNINDLSDYARNTNPDDGFREDCQGSFLALPRGERLNGRMEIITPRRGLAMLIFDLYVNQETELTVLSDQSAVGFVTSLSGNSRRIVTGEFRPVEPIAVDPGKMLAGRCLAGPSLLEMQETSRHRFVKVQCNGPFLSSLRNEYQSASGSRLAQVLGPNPVPAAIVRDTLSPALGFLAHQVIRCPLVGASRRFFLEAKALEMVALAISEGFPTERLANSGYDDLTQERLLEARSILESEFADPPSIKALARRCGLNEFKLKRGFRELFSTTVFGYVRKLRMERARMLLEAGNLNVTEAALEAGYSSLGHFAARFKKHYGVLPKEYGSRR
jgi:AraC-like DNA-binding protein